MLGSSVVEICSPSQFIGITDMALHSASGRSSSSSGVLVEHDRLGKITSSCRWSRVGDSDPDGWRERASLVWLCTPGM